jgi:hypothetical protein
LKGEAVTVSRLIADLQRLPPDAPVGYLAHCADDGDRFIEIDGAETREADEYAPPRIPGMPQDRVFVVMT